MDNCIECKIKETSTILLCVDCDDKLKIKIKKHIRDNWNRQYDWNENISRQQLRCHN